MEKEKRSITKIIISVVLIVAILAILVILIIGYVKKATTKFKIQ